VASGVDVRDVRMRFLLFETYKFPIAEVTAKLDMKSARLFLIPGSEDTLGHGTTGFAKFWKEQVRNMLDAAPRRGN
jgi:hypothetical protein